MKITLYSQKCLITSSLKSDVVLMIVRLSDGLKNKMLGTSELHSEGG